MPPVSICLTTYNRASTLGATIESVLAQSFADFELIVSDDCSTDETAAVCVSYERLDRRVRYRRNEANLKMPGNLNAALAAASGALVANLHDGDIYRPDLIASWKSALDRYPSAAFVFNAYEIDWGGRHAICSVPFDGVLPRMYVARYFFETFSCCVWGTVMGRRELYAAAGWFQPRYGFISDVDMWLTLTRCHDCVHIPEPLIRLAQRELTHPYAYHSWDHLFWQFAIYAKQLQAYRSLIGEEEFRRFASGFESLKLRRFGRAMLSLIKHRRWDRVRDGLAIWQRSPMWTLSTAGRLLGSGQVPPAWYRPAMWQEIVVRNQEPTDSAGLRDG